MGVNHGDSHQYSFSSIYEGFWSAEFHDPDSRYISYMHSWWYMIIHMHKICPVLSLMNNYNINILHFYDLFHWIWFRSQIWLISLSFCFRIRDFQDVNSQNDTASIQIWSILMDPLGIPSPTPSCLRPWRRMPCWDTEDWTSELAMSKIVVWYWFRKQ